MGNFNAEWLSQASLGSLKVSNLIPAAVVLVVCIFVSRAIMKFVANVLEKSPIERSLHAFLRSTLKIALYVITALIVADKLGIPITSLIALLSVVGLAVSLAVQGTLSNLAGGIMILLSKPFVVGDYIEAGDASGTVEEIGLIYTRVLSADNKTVFFPNSDIASAKVVNYTVAGSRRVDIIIGASYDAPTATVKAALQKCADRHKEILLDTPKPVTAIWEYKDSCIEYLLRVWVTSENYWDMYFALREDVREEFEAADIEMTYPHMNVHILDKA